MGSMNAPSSRAIQAFEVSLHSRQGISGIKGVFAQAGVTAHFQAEPLRLRHHPNTHFQRNGLNGPRSASSPSGCGNGSNFNTVSGTS